MKTVAEVMDGLRKSRPDFLNKKEGAKLLLATYRSGRLIRLDAEVRDGDYFQTHDGLFTTSWNYLSNLLYNVSNQLMKVEQVGGEVHWSIFGHGVDSALTPKPKLRLGKRERLQAKQQLSLDPVDIDCIRTYEIKYSTSDPERMYYENVPNNGGEYIEYLARRAKGDGAYWPSYLSPSSFERLKILEAWLASRNFWGYPKATVHSCRVTSSSNLKHVHKNKLNFIARELTPYAREHFFLCD